MTNTPIVPDETIKEWEKLGYISPPKNDLATLREQIQEDLICMLESQLGEVEYLQELQDIACQIVVDNFNKVM